MNFSIIKFGFLLVLVSLTESCRQSREEIKNPNILLIYMDDLGYGDVSSYSVGTLSTPNIDRISKNGIRFTNGYSTSATCTPVDMQFFLENTLGEIKEHKFCLEMHHYYLIYQRKHYPLY